MGKSDLYDTVEMFAFDNILNKLVFKPIISIVFIGFLPRLLSPADTVSSAT
jgi:hypothetical protein